MFFIECLRCQNVFCCSFAKKHDADMLIEKDAFLSYLTFLDSFYVHNTIYKLLVLSYQSKHYNQINYVSYSHIQNNIIRWWKYCMNMRLCVSIKRIQCLLHFYLSTTLCVECSMFMLFKLTLLLQEEFYLCVQMYVYSGCTNITLYAWKFARR